MKHYLKIPTTKLSDWKITDPSCSCKVGKISRNTRRPSISLFLCPISFSVLYAYISIATYTLNRKLCKMKWMKKLNPLIPIALHSWPLQLGALTCRVELNKLHVFVRESSSGYHGSAVSCTGVGWGAWEIGSSISTTRQDISNIYNHT